MTDSSDPLVALLALVGRWQGEGRGSYPTIRDFGYSEEITFAVVAGKPFLSYSSRTTHADDGRPLHAEVGWLRAAGDRRYELVVAQGSGLVEIVEGELIDGDQGLDLQSTLVGGSSSAKSVTATTRTYRWDKTSLSYDLSMAAVDQPLQHHLSARLTRDPTG